MGILTFQTHTFKAEYTDDDKSIFNTAFDPESLADAPEGKSAKQVEMIQTIYLEASRIAHIAIDRRYGIHRFFILIFSSISVLFASLARFDLVANVEISLLMVFLVCMFMSFVWYLWVDFLLRQSEARQNVLEQLESALPTKLYQSTNANIDMADHVSFSWVERGMPIFVGITSLISAVTLLLWIVEPG